MVTVLMDGKAFKSEQVRKPANMLQFKAFEE